MCVGVCYYELAGIPVFSLLHSFGCATLLLLLSSTQYILYSNRDYVAPMAFTYVCTINSMHHAEYVVGRRRIE